MITLSLVMDKDLGVRKSYSSYSSREFTVHLGYLFFSTSLEDKEHSTWQFFNVSMAKDDNNEESLLLFLSMYEEGMNGEHLL